MRTLEIIGLTVWLLVGPTALFADSAEPHKSKIVVLAGKKSHGPEGNGIHDYGWSAKAVKVMLDNSNVADRVETEIHLNGWPKDLDTFNSADAIVIISDGRDGDNYSEALHLESPDKIELISKQAQRGCGIVTFHFSTFAPDRYAEQVLDWIGGYFDWETDGKRQWYSAIQVADTGVELPTPDHPASRGVKPFRLNEEFYFNLRFHPATDGVVPILSVPALPGRTPDGRVVAWARQRRDGGRGFGTTCGHFYDNWRNPSFRRLVLNGLVWAAKAEVPDNGVDSTFYTHDEITQALQGKTGTAPATVDQRPIRVLMFAGNDAHKWHNWETTTPAIRDLLEVDPRIKVDVSFDIEDLARKKLGDYQAILLNYANWHDPRSLSDAAKTALTVFLQRGGGLLVIHFANGAFHFSLPEAGASDWPEYRRIVRRVWNHQGKGDQQSSHDPYGPFRVDVTKATHPITDGLSSFDVVDELYFHQAGDEPIEPLLSARSNVTGQDEPLAFAYRYGDGRIFQTFLGHSERTYEPFEAREILRRALAWTSNRPIRPRTVEEDPGAKRPEPRASADADPLVPGRFGKAINARVASATAAGRDEYRTWPLTVECWAKLDERSGFNILVACDPKSSTRHWELFTQAGSGALALYVPGRNPDHVRSNEDICDGRWHYVAATLADDGIVFFVDGREVAKGPATANPVAGGARAGGLSFGTLVERGLGCAGLIDDVRIRRGVHAIGPPPDNPFEPNESTIGLWHFDKTANDEIVDFSASKNPAQLSGGEKSPAAQAQDKHDEHYSEAALGFRWTEQDSVDNRWNQTQVGPFLASIVPLPGQPPVCKGLTIRVGGESTASVLYDTQTMAFRAAWIDGFLKFDPTRFGLISPPAIAGQLKFLTLPYAPTLGELQYRGLYWNGRNVVLSYQVDGREVLELPAYEKVDDSGAFVREIEFAPSEKPTTLALGAFRGPVKFDRGRRIATLDGGNPPCAIGVDGDAVNLESPIEGTLAISIPPARQSWKIRVILAQSPVQVQKTMDSSRSRTNPRRSLPSLLSPGPRLWNQPIVTQGKLGKDAASYAIDEVTLPFDNPYRALLFVSGHDFFSNGDLAVCTAHGDVWRVSGVNASLTRLEWKRFATGLFQALGLRVVNDAVFVLGRDQITKLMDEDGDGQADRYECFHNGYETSSGGHDFVTCLETDSAGNFYFLHATLGLVRVSKDGKHEDVVATGFRNPNGLGVFPDGSITVAPQEGEWTPSSAIIQTKPGGFYGYKGPQPTSTRPLGYDPPLCWIPRLTDNSGGGQVWSPVQNWGPLSNRPIHLSYGQCRMQILLRESVGEVMQGGVAPLPYEFRSGVMRGRVNPTDGQLYVSGLKGWVTSAVDDGCLCRVRWTGKPSTVPINLRTYRNGVSLEFTDALDPSTAGDPDRYSVLAWNYRYAAEYGSADYRPSDPKSVGRDEWSIASATLQPGGRSVFLEIPNIRPVMQLALEYRLKTARLDKLNGSVFYTIHNLGSDTMPPEKLDHRPRPGLLPDAIASKLEPGVLLRFEQNGATDAVSARMMAWGVPEATSPTFTLSPGPFKAAATAYLKAPTPGTYSFSMSGAGVADLAINGQTVFANADLAKSPSNSVDLHKGHNAIALRYASPSSGPASFRILWESEFFAAEPLPPTALSHDSQYPELVRGKLLRQGKSLWDSHRCGQCHRDDSSMPSNPGPSLEGIGSRIEPAWLARWIADPRAVRTSSTMPAMHATASDRAEIADVVAYLGTLTAPSKTTTADSGKEDAGLALYENLGCIACHRTTPESRADGRIDLGPIVSKFRPGELERFLRKPQEHFASTRMPDFQLTSAEACSLASHLRSIAKAIEPPPFDLALGDEGRGREAFQSRGCANCHSVDRDPPVARPFGPKRPARLDHGCLASKVDRRGTAPQFEWTNSEREALAVWLQRRPETQPAPALADEAESHYVRLNCQACHSRDGQAGARGMILAEESEIGLAPESLPDLTWAGEKLRADWLKRQFAGELSYRSRPWLKARMPAFPAFADRLAAGIAAQHGILPPSDRAPTTLHAEAPIGGETLALAEKLIGTSGGLDCRSCHAVGEQKPKGDDRTQISPGINLVHVRDRMRAEHFRRFLLDPPRFDIATRMPKLANDGRTKVLTVLDGDASRQFDLIWRYIQSLSDDALP